ncbi:hypothetical protein EDF56_104346 [Novosphingobium sp. PhB165]|uniref:hypothetical protein n=1 Tax=Novosphingobium sp. PhB165 TaxID=2485105 RepID=UPI00104651AE|nr:hypothetical protein [Novosphingobium sp. PhB165]TCM18812.1 hypothetical protein EDF56_104346 [Novosphingobium sp. PhB165]
MNRLSRELASIGVTLRDSLRLWRLAPLVPLIAVLPEFAQHAVEIRLGMFASQDAFASLALDPMRTNFGVLKIAALVLAVLVGARFWANRSAGTRGWSLAEIGWKQVLLGLFVQVAVSLPGMFGQRLSPVTEATLGMALTLASLPALVLMVGGLLGDRETGLLGIYRSGWAKALRILLHIGPVWLLLQTLHRADHIAALDRPQWLVWGLMAWDALLVGQMAALVATGLHHGYAADDEGDEAGFTAA